MFFAGFAACWFNVIAKLVFCFVVPRELFAYSFTEHVWGM